MENKKAPDSPRLFVMESGAKILGRLLGVLLADDGVYLSIEGSRVGGVAGRWNLKASRVTSIEKAPAFAPSDLYEDLQ